MVEHLTLDEKKKAVQKILKADKEKLASASASTTSSATAAAGANAAAKIIDTDPYGESYLKAGQYLVQAAKFVKPLIRSSPKDHSIRLLLTQYYQLKGIWMSPYAIFAHAVFI